MEPKAPTRPRKPDFVPDAYKILEISKNSSDKEVKSAYRMLIQRFHPDRIGSKGEEQTKLLNLAYEQVETAEKRARYELRYAKYKIDLAEYKKKMTEYQSELKEYEQWQKARAQRSARVAQHRVSSQQSGAKTAQGNAKAKPEDKNHQYKSSSGYTKTKSTGGPSSTRPGNTNNTRTSSTTGRTAPPRSPQATPSANSNRRPNRPGTAAAPSQRYQGRHTKKSKWGAVPFTMLLLLVAFASATLTQENPVSGPIQETVSNPLAQAPSVKSPPVATTAPAKTAPPPPSPEEIRAEKERKRKERINSLTSSFLSNTKWLKGKRGDTKVSVDRQRAKQIINRYLLIYHPGFTLDGENGYFEEYTSEEYYHLATIDVGTEDWDSQYIEVKIPVRVSPRQLAAFLKRKKPMELSKSDIQDLEFQKSLAELEWLNESSHNKEITINWSRASSIVNLYLERYYPNYHVGDLNLLDQALREDEIPYFEFWPVSGSDNKFYMRVPKQMSRREIIYYLSHKKYQP